MNTVRDWWFMERKNHKQCVFWGLVFLCMAFSACDRQRISLTITTEPTSAATETPSIAYTRTVTSTQFLPPTATRAAIPTQTPIPSSMVTSTPQPTLTMTPTPHPSVTSIQLPTRTPRTPRTPHPTPTEDARALLSLKVISPGNVTGLTEVGGIGNGYIVQDAAWAPGGNFFALATSQGIFFYDAATYEESRFSEKPAESLAFSHDGKRLAIGRCDYDPRKINCTSPEFELWQLNPKQRLYTQNTEYGISRIAFSSDGQYLATGEGSGPFGGAANLRRASDGEIIFPAGEFNYRFIAVFSPDGETLVTEDLDNILTFWRVPDGSVERTLQVTDSKGGNAMVAGIAFSPDDETLALSTDTGIQLRQSSDLALIRTLKHYPAGDFVFSPDGETLAWGVGYKVNLMRVTDGEILQSLPTSDSRAFPAYSPDGRKIVTASVLSDSPFYLWQLPEGILLKAFSSHAFSVESMDIIQNGAWLVTDGNMDGAHGKRVWRFSDSALLNVYFGKNIIESFSFSPAGTLVAAVERDYSTDMEQPIILPATIREATTGQLVQTLPVNEEWYSFSQIAFSPDGSLVAVASGDVRVFRVSDGGLVTQLSVEYASKVSFSADSKLLLTEGWGDYINVWQLPDGSMLSQVDVDSIEVCNIVFSPDSTKFAVGADNGVTVWRTLDGQLERQVVTYGTGEGWGFHQPCVAFSPDGKLLAFEDQIWRTSDWTIVHKFEDYFRWLIFTPDGKMLLASNGERVSFYGIP